VGRVLVSTVKALRWPNQLSFRVMSGTPAGSPTPSTAYPAVGSGLALIISGIVLVGGIAALALVSARAAEPIILAIVAVLAMLGVFFIFGILAGHIRLDDRTAPEAFAAALADSLDQGVMVTARNGSVMTANAEYRNIVGCNPDGEPIALDVAFAGDPAAAECLFRLVRAAERGEVRSEEFRVRGNTVHGRSARWLRLTVRPLAGVGVGGDGANLWQIADVSGDRAREAEAVRELEASLALYARVHVGLLVAAPDGRATHINDTLADWLGLDPEAARARVLTLGDVIAGSGEALLRTSLLRSKGQSVHLELDLVREDGIGLPVEIVGRIESDGPHAGEITALVLARATTAQDTTQPGATDAQFTRLVQSAPFGIATIGEGGRILTSNAAFARMFVDAGVPEADTIDALAAATGDAETRRAVETALLEARSGRTSLAPIELTFGPDGQIARRIYVSPVTNGSHHGETAMIYTLDATEQKALELKYAQSTKMEAVGKLAGGIAHDFNNVLTAIIGFSDLLLQTHRPTDAAYKDIMNIKQNANRAAGLVRQLLAFSRRQTLQPETLDLREVLNDLSILLKRLIGEHIDLKIVDGRDLWFVKADRTQFDQVVINLAVNAKDAMPEGGKLLVRTSNVSERESLKLRSQSVLPGEYVLIEVEDNGTGMSPEVMAKIFEPFFSTKEVGKGTGLGLSTVYGIVKQTGGYVFPESTPGKGTIFRLYLPRHIPDPAAKEEANAARELKKERPRDLTGTGRVLLVEDEDSVRNFAARALKRQGYEVLEATTGLEALEVVAREKGRIDLVVSDVVMPEMDGPTMFNVLRKENPDLRVIFVSGYPDDRFTSTLAPGQQFAFLPKPFTLPQLAAKVKEEMER
jgi:two-component system, cell cycle sensor histidine kinase and response regulator CckA